MGKGVIMELMGSKAVVLTPDGEFMRIRLANDHHHTVGQEISLDVAVTNRKFSPFKNIRTIPAFSYGAAFIVFCLILTNFFFFQSPNHAVAAYVSFDVNPSIEVSIDDDLEVVKVEAINDDAKKLVPNIEDYYGKNIDEFANFFFTKLKTSGYLNNYDEILVVTTIKNKDAKKEENIEQHIQEKINQAKESTIAEDKVEVVVKSTTYKNHEDAKKNGFTTGKYITYLDAKNNGSKITMDEAKKMPIAKLKEKAHPEKGKAKDHTKTQKGNNSGKDNNNGVGNGKDKNNDDQSSNDHPSQSQKDKNKDNKSNNNNGEAKKNEHNESNAHSNSGSKEDKSKKKSNDHSNDNSSHKNRDIDNEWKNKSWKNNNNKNNNKHDEVSSADPFDQYRQYYFILKKDQ